MTRDEAKQELTDGYRKMRAAQDLYEAGKVGYMEPYFDGLSVASIEDEVGQRSRELAAIFGFDLVEEVDAEF